MAGRITNYGNAQKRAINTVRQISNHTLVMAGAIKVVEHLTLTKNIVDIAYIGFFYFLFLGIKPM